MISTTRGGSAGTVPTRGDALVEVRHLKKYFPVASGILDRSSKMVRAVDDVSFAIRPGETLGLVGESGCGKTTLGRLILRLLPATDGQVMIDGTDTLRLSGRRLREMRRNVQAVFQDPLGSLNPRMKVAEIVGEPLQVFGETSGGAVRRRVTGLLREVGLDAKLADSYPHQLSGGQRQRVGIARAISLQPRFIVADEPVSALDVSVQAQIINLLVQLQQELGMAYLFIGHGLAVVRHISHRIGVMYMGQLVELADSDTIFASPAHPYTVALLAAAPVADPTERRERLMLKGELPSPTNLPSGCRFRTRCPLAQARCAEEAPAFREVRPGHWAACHFPVEA